MGEGNGPAGRAVRVLAHSPFEPMAIRAGAVMVARDGSYVPAHYGSVAGELAVLKSAVGMADRSDIGKLEVRARPELLEYVAAELAHGTLAPGGARHTSTAWWCADTGARILVLCEAGASGALQSQLEDAVQGAPGAAVEDLGPKLAAVELLGPATADLLTAMGAPQPAAGDEADATFAPAHLSGLPVLLLHESRFRSLVLVESGHAGRLWEALDRAGEEFGLSCVGDEAAHRFDLLERSMERSAPVLPT